MCGGIHYGEVEGVVSVERWSCNRGASCVCVRGGYTVTNAHSITQGTSQTATNRGHQQ